MEITVAEALVRCLEQENVKLVFGYPGGAILPVYDALHNSTIKHVLVRHEQGAVHAADGYARVTGKVGVCMATSGPGATNLVTGIANAYMDSVPLVLITGQVPVSQIGTDAFQEVDITGITIPVTKHNFLIKDPEQLPQTVKKAFHIAATGRPGPVLIDLPKDVAQAKIKFAYPKNVYLPGYKPTYKGHQAMVNQAAKIIMAAKRPVIYAGGGVRSANAAPELRQLAETIAAPVTHTLMGLGCFPGDHPLFLGMLGLHGTRYANQAVTECDCLIAVGARFDDRVVTNIEGFAPEAKVIHIDIDPAEIGKNVRVDVPIAGDVRMVLGELVPKIEANAAERAEWLAKIDEWKREYPLSYNQGEDCIKPQYVIEQIYEATQGEAIITTEVGQHQMWAAQHYKYVRPRSLVTSGGLGTMGFGLPAAIGAQIGMPDRLVFDISGDGSFQMNSQELATAVSYNLPIKVAILNNGYLGMVRQWQKLFYGGRYSQTDLEGLSPDFVKLAEAYGVTGIRVTRPEEVRPAIEQAIATPGPVLIDFVVDREENVYPMVPPGGCLDNMLGGCTE